MTKRCKAVFFKMYSFDTIVFNKMVLDAYSNPIIINLDFQKIWIAHGFVFRKTKSISFINITTKNELLNYYIVPFTAFLNLLLCFSLILFIFLKYRPEVALVEHTYVSVFAGFLRRLGLCNKSIYMSGDWVANDPNKTRLLGHIHCNIIFPFLDRIACRLNDEVWNLTSKIESARSNFWGKNITHSQKLYYFKPHLLVEEKSLKRDRLNILFLGQIRNDSGLDLAFCALKEIQKRIDSKIIIVGPENAAYESTKRLACEMGVKEYVDFMGFVKTENLPELTKNCFCALNILTSKCSYSSYTLPGKFYHYLQLALPIITTNSTGVFSEVIIEKSLGIVIEPNIKELVEGLNHIYYKQSMYRNHIVEYINSIPDVDIKYLLEGK